MTRLAPLALAVALTGCPKSSAPEPAASASACTAEDGSRTFKIIHVNDTYRIEGLSDGRGGIARLRTLRKQLEADGCPVAITHAGDMFFPSLLSRSYKGAQMVDVLNRLDGDAEAADPYFVATFGNHEFDKPALKYASLVDSRVEESQFTWLDTNIAWKAGEDGAPLVAADNLVEHHIMELNGVKIGFFGVITDMKMPEYAEAIDTDYVDIVASQTKALREAGADVVIALTHLDARTDVDVLEKVAAEHRPDLALGGHNHTSMTLQGGGVTVAKADADAVTARIVTGRVAPDGTVSFELDDPPTPIGPETPVADPELKAVVDGWLAKYRTEFCGDRGPDCLDEKLTVAGNTLVAEELEIRRYETNLGDWVAQHALDMFAEDGAQLAIINSGSLRLNQDIPAGSTVTRRVVEEIFAYPAPMHLLEVKGADIQAIIDRAIYDWTGSGHFLQIAGFAYVHDVEAGASVRPHLLTADGPVPIDPEATYKLVVGDYLISPEMGDQDGYTMLSKDMMIASENHGSDLKARVVEALKQAGDAGIEMELKGRICTTDRPDSPCLVPAEAE